MDANRMFDEFRGRPGRKLLPSGERGEIAPAGYRELRELLPGDFPAVACRS